MDRYIVALTGHRLQDLSPAQRDKAKEGITTALTKLKEEHGEKLLVLSGMATGVDQFGAQICCDLGIDWTACVPHENYFNAYPAARNEELLAKAFKVRYICSGKWHYKMNFARNEYMMNWAQEIIACAKFKLSEIPAKGGTAHMVSNSIRAGKKITLINLNEGN